jgi:putative transcriptional regulator
MKQRNEWRLKGEADCEPLHYTACGLDDVYLLSGWKREETKYGNGMSIKDLDGLHRAIGLYLVCQKKALSGSEIRFLRKEMDLTQEELGELVGLTGQQVARWEKDKSDISGSGELLLRVLYIQHTGGKGKIKELARKIRALDDRGDQKHLFKSTRDGWAAQAA